MIWSDIPGWFDFQELYARVAREATDESVLIEVGCWRGRSIAYLARELQHLGKQPRLLAAIDTWRGSVAEEHMQETIRGLGGTDALYLDFLENMVACGVRSLVRPLRMESTVAARLFAPASVDFCFIDASHDEASVRADLAAWLPRVKPGGTLAGHDLNAPGVWPPVKAAFGDDFETVGLCWVKRMPP